MIRNGNNFPKRAFWIIVGVQFLILLTMIAQRQHLLATGTRVVISCRPVDPRSLLSGDYVILNFDISTFDFDSARTNITSFGEDFKRGDTVFVALQPDKNGDLHTIAAVSLKRENLDNRWPIVLRGRCKSHYGKNMTLRYGVEQYFVPQFEGKAIERKMGSTTVELAVAHSGQSAIRRLFIAGQEVSFY